MKNYLAEAIDLTGDSYLNPVPAVYDNGQHPRNINQITSISIHHDASFREHDYDSVARYHSEAAGHYSRLGPGLQYHYKIDNVGQIFQIRPLTTWLYSVGSFENVTTMAICLDGNFEFQQPTREQLEALYQLIENLCTQHPEFPATWPDVRSHNDFSATACSGANLRDRILPIQDQVSAQAQLLNVGEYDWPTYQPGYQVPTPPPPAVAVPVKTPDPIVPASTVPTPPVVPATPPPIVEPDKQTPCASEAPSPAPTQPTTPNWMQQLRDFFGTTQGRTVLGVLATGIAPALMYLQHFQTDNALLAAAVLAAVTLLNTVKDALNPNVPNK
ncbi:hypothetical protein QF038_001862 [Pseudarthrobacter sp. W1I19]|uniref:peptidoglycan recognition protein family protein n=1 Tax=Pseudarthrobacter sp. W1I19 TaxID=3042288 RepID=UPI0027893885|nr:peptidoglycan recognition family protein [Pseudarthrobacter sp. W1I19]MDQ0923354.1 hypothetical protein [Pseudarthrobacter sp. W1I19]